MAKTYQIGQVLYIVSETTQKVVPIQIREIHKKQTIEGEETIYMVMDPQETGPHNLQNIDGEIFVTSKEVSSFLKNAAGQAIDQMVEFAEKVAASKFGASKDTSASIFNSKPKPVVPPPPKTGGMSREVISEELGNSPDDIIENVGPDGKIQKMKVRSVQMAEPS